MVEQYHNYVNGSWTDAETGESFETEDPAAPAEIVAEYQDSGVKDAGEAVKAAADAQDEWADTPAPERGAILRATATILTDRKDELTKPSRARKVKRTPRLAARSSVRSTFSTTMPRRPVIWGLG